MSGGKGGFTLRMWLDDEATPKLDALNRRIHALYAPAEKFNKSMEKFGQVTGIARVSEGVKGLGDTALEAARSMERMVTPLGLLSSAGSIAGVVALTKHWADAGNEIGKVSYRLNTPVENLSALGIAASTHGSSVAAMSSSVETLNQKLRAIAFHTGGADTNYFKQMGIDAGTPGHINDVTNALRQLADFVKSKALDPGAQAHALERAGVDPDLLPLLKDGAEGLDKALAEARQTRGVMTKEMTAEATALANAWGRIGANIGGVINRLQEKYSPLVRELLNDASSWMEGHPDQAQTAAEVGIAGAAVAGYAGVAKLARMVGIGAALPGVSTLFRSFAPLLFLGGAGGEDPEFSEKKNKEFLRDRAARGAGPRVGAPIDYRPSFIVGQMNIGDDKYAAYTRGVAQIEHAGYKQMGGSSGRFAGRYQLGSDEIEETAAMLGVPRPSLTQFRSDPAMQERFMEAYTAGHDRQLMEESAAYRDMSPDERLKVLGYAHNQGVRGAERWLKTGMAGHDAFGTSGVAYSDSVDRELKGTVHVTVHVNDGRAGPRVDAHAAATGIATTAPPTVGRSMLQ